MVFGWLKGKKKDEAATAEPVPVTGPLGLRIGRSVDLDFIEFSALSSKLSKPIEDDITLVVTGHGKVELEPGVFLHRFYDDEHRFLQIIAEGTGETARVTDATFFRHWDSVTPSPASLNSWVGKNGLIGAKTYDADGTAFDRAWQPEESGWVPPVEFTEEVNDDDGKKTFVRQAIMLYDRMISENLAETLIISREEVIGGSRDGASVEFYLGILVDPPSIRPI